MISGSRLASSSKNVCWTPMQNSTRSAFVGLGAVVSHGHLGSRTRIYAPPTGRRAPRRGAGPVGCLDALTVSSVRNSFLHLVVKYVW